MAYNNSQHPTHIQDASWPLVTTGPTVGITVAELVALAAAGVTINLSEIAQHVRPNPPAEKILFDATPLLKPLMLRWRQYTEIKYGSQIENFEVRKYPFFLSAWSNTDKVFVFVCPLTVSCEPTILTDEALMYPSDALMGKLQLLLETHQKVPSTVEATNGIGAGPVPKFLSRA